MSDNLSFSKFKSREFSAISKQLCSVFNTTNSELKLLYKEIINDFNKDGWPENFVSRDFFKSEDDWFQKAYLKSPVIAIDLPSIFELDDGSENKSTIVILGQDSKSDQDSKAIRLGTPYGLHHKGSRETLKRTKLYFDMVNALLELGYRVYLTDIYKVWVCDPNRPYKGLTLPKVDREKFISALQLEISAMNPVALVTWGKPAAHGLSQINSDVQKLPFPHPSSAAGGAWKKLMNQSPSNENKLAFWSAEISKILSNLDS